jgi:hypothetical protein
VRTEAPRSEVDPKKPRVPRDLLGGTIMVVGFVLTVLGIYEIGGLFTLSVGLGLLFVGSIPVLLHVKKRDDAMDVEFRRIVGGR